MAIWKKKEKGYVDLSEKMRKQQEKAETFRQNVSSDETPIETVGSNNSSEKSNGGFFGGFFGGGSSNSSDAIVPAETESANPEERKRKLAKRLMDMTKRLEDMENEIYQLKQKLEVLEHKQRVGY
jgi:predicted  nucleic acid-binding Zn-ribbon protein